MAFLIDQQELKPGLIIFRRADVKHRNFYCRIKLPKADRYKTVSLKTADPEAAKDRAFDEDADVRFRIKHEVPIFSRSFSEIAKDFASFQEERCNAGEISAKRLELVQSVIRAQLNPYVGNVQITLIGQDKWTRYPIWRKTGSKGLNGRVSDATVRTEMSIFRAVMAFAASKKYINESQIFKGKLPLDKVRREHFTPEEYKHLYTFARGWAKGEYVSRGKEVKKQLSALNVWYRAMVRNLVLIMCNTGLRPPEAKNLRWRDIDIRTDRQDRKFVVLRVRGKNKSRELVAAESVANYLQRVRDIAKAKELNDFVFTNYEGEQSKDLYKRLMCDLLGEAELLNASSGSRRSTYCYRHTYATFRLSEGVDVYHLAKQMGTSVKIIEDHYGHTNPVKNADRILQGLPGWEPMATAPKLDQAGAVNEDKASHQATKGAKPKTSPPNSARNRKTGNTQRAPTRPA